MHYVRCVRYEITALNGKSGGWKRKNVADFHETESLGNVLTLFTNCYARETWGQDLYATPPVESSFLRILG